MWVKIVAINSYSSKQSRSKVLNSVQKLGRKREKEEFVGKEFRENLERDTSEELVSSKMRKETEDTQVWNVTASGYEKSSSSELHKPCSTESYITLYSFFCFFFRYSVRCVVLAIFICTLSISAMLAPSVEVGLDQELSMPKDSHVLKYFHVGISKSLIDFPNDF